MKISKAALFVFLLMQAACSAGTDSSPIGEVQTTTASDQCVKLMAQLTKHLDNMRFDLRDADLMTLVPAIRKECPQSFDRDINIAGLMATGPSRDEAFSLLQKIESSDDNDEPKRLALMYSIYLKDLNYVLASNIARRAKTRFSSNAYSRMIFGVDTCLHGSCRDAQNDLLYADQELHSVAALPYLAYSFADSGNFFAAAQCFDKLHEAHGLQALNDMVVYVGVISYINVGRGSDAQQLLADFLRLHPEADSVDNIVKAKAAIASVSPSTSTP